MSLQFSRSMRSLKLDSYQAARLGMILAVIIMLVLTAWFFFGKVTVFEHSTTLEITPDSHVIAEFDTETIQSIQPGQAATVRLATGSNQPMTTLPAEVYSVDPATHKVELVFLSGELPAGDAASGFSTAGEKTGRIDVEIEYVTPLTLVLRASGRYLNTSQVSTSPSTQQGNPAP